MAFWYTDWVWQEDTLPKQFVKGAGAFEEKSYGFCYFYQGMTLWMYTGVLFDNQQLDHLFHVAERGDWFARCKALSGLLEVCTNDIDLAQYTQILELNALDDIPNRRHDEVDMFIPATAEYLKRLSLNLLHRLEGNYRDVNESPIKKGILTRTEHIEDEFDRWMTQGKPTKKPESAPQKKAPLMPPSKSATPVKRAPLLVPTK